MISADQKMPWPFEAYVHSAMSLPRQSLQLRSYQSDISTSDVVHKAFVLVADILHFLQGFPLCDHKAELLAEGKLLSTEGTRCRFFAAVTVIQATVPLKEVLP